MRFWCALYFFEICDHVSNCDFGAFSNYSYWCFWCGFFHLIGVWKHMTHPIFHQKLSNTFCTKIYDPVCCKIFLIWNIWMQNLQATEFFLGQRKTCQRRLINLFFDYGLTNGQILIWFMGFIISQCLKNQKCRTVGHQAGDITMVWTEKKYEMRTLTWTRIPTTSVCFLSNIKSSSDLLTMIL